MIATIAALLMSQAVTTPAEPAPVKPLVLPWSPDFIEPSGMWRAHFVSRATFSDGQSAFSDAMAWAYELRAFLRITDGVAVSLVMPFGVARGYEDETRTVFGNLSAGFSVGGALIDDPGFKLRLAGSLDGYAPTSVSRDTTAHTLGLLAALRSYEAQLYIPRTAGARVRGQVEATFSIVTVAAELGLVPAGSLVRGDGGFYMLLSGAARASLAVSESVEPFVEAGGSIGVAGEGDLKPPFILTPGIRFHFAEIFDPAIFVSVNFVESSTVMFGVDLSFAVRPSPLEKKRSELGRDEDDFMREDYLDF